MPTYTVIDAATGEVVHEQEIPTPDAPPSVDLDALRATVSKATTVAQLRGAMLAYLDATAQ